MADKKKIYSGSHCAAINCSNNKGKCPEKSFFRFPLDRSVFHYYVCCIVLHTNKSLINARAHKVGWALLLSVTPSSYVTK